MPIPDCSRLHYKSLFLSLTAGHAAHVDLDVMVGDAGAELGLSAGHDPLSRRV